MHEMTSLEKANSANSLLNICKEGKHEVEM